MFWTRFGSILESLEVSGAPFCESWGPILAPLEVPWPPFGELWGSPERRGRLVIDPSGDRVANRDFFMTFSTHFGARFGPVLGAKIL